MREAPRQRLLYWVDSLGKLSLADVVVVVLLLAVFDVHVYIDAARDLGPLASVLSSPAVAAAVNVTSSDLDVRLFVVGLKGWVVWEGRGVRFLFCLVSTQPPPLTSLALTCLALP